MIYFSTLRVEDECDFQLESDEEELEPPLPLRSDDEWQFYNPFLTHQHYTQSYGKEKYLMVSCLVDFFVQCNLMKHFVIVFKKFYMNLIQWVFFWMKKQQNNDISCRGSDNLIFCSFTQKKHTKNNIKT